MIRAALTLARADLLGAGLMAALLLVLLFPPLVAYEPVWEAAASLGYVACFALIVTLRLAPAARHAARSYRFAVHRAAGLACIASVAAHVGVMVAGDPFVPDYLGWLMPLHVLAGLLGAAALLLATATREPVLRSALPLGGGPRLHAWSGFVAGALVAGHVIGSSSKLTAPWQPLLVAGVFVALLIPVSGRGGSATSAPVRVTGTDINTLLALLGALAILLMAAPALVARLTG
jgi:hypothetical protein